MRELTIKQWEYLDKNWNILLSLFEIGLPCFAFKDYRGRVIEMTMKEHIIELKEKRDSELCYYLDLAWDMLPNRPFFHTHPNWHILHTLV